MAARPTQAVSSARVSPREAPRIRNALARALAVAAAALAAAPARAQPTQLGQDGEPIQTSDYTIDLYEGPVLAGSRVIGLGGAFAPIADGVVGYAFNPAAVARRVPWSTTWFDWEIDGGITLPSSVTGVDFDNSGDDSFTNTANIFLMGGGGLQFGDLGVGATVDYNRYEINAREGEGELLFVNIIRALLVAGYGFLDGELTAGLGVSANSVNITRPPAEAGGEERQVANVPGASAHAGVLWAPAYLPLRAGASVRWPLTSKESVPEGVEADAAGNFVSEGYYLPRTITLPAEVQAGVAVQLFRPMNLPWVNPRDEAGAARRLQLELDWARARRRRKADERLREAEAAGARGRELDALEQGLERAEDLARAEEAERLARAKEADKQRRLRPYREMPREKLLVSAAVKITLPVKNGVGLESFIEQRVERSGSSLSFSPRLGVEGEAIPGYLVLRAGTYYEPTRFEPSPAKGHVPHPRVHGTGGLDVRIPLAWSVFGLFDDDTTFRVGGAVDAAARYFGWSVSAGLWR